MPEAGTATVVPEEREAWLEQTRAWADDQLERAVGELEGTPPRLLEALRYALFGGGKRLRPTLVRACCDLVGGLDEQAGRAAAAVELLHTYSLVHDDLPCMDDDDLRRGRPTCHKVYGEATAVLVGDALQAAAFEQTAGAGDERGARMTYTLARAAGSLGMVGGQELDLASSAGAGLDEVVEIHRRKTGALLAASVELGVLAAHPDWDPDEPRRAALREYGEAVGLCFQAVDDLLDVTGDAGSLGKTPGKDMAAGKATLVSARGVDGAAEAARSAASTARSAARRAGASEGHPTFWIIDRMLRRTS